MSGFPYLNGVPPVFLILFGVLTALCLGSFANVVILRLPQGRSIVHPGSSCPACGHRLRWWENIPVLSFCFLRGRCSSCGAAISPLYPLGEISLALFMAAVTWRHAAHPALWPWGWGLSFYLWVIAVVDARHQLIPDGLSLSLLAAGLLTSPFHPFMAQTHLERFLTALGGAATGFGFMAAVAWGGRKIWKKDALGGGDIKLMAAVGAFTGPTGVFQVVAVGSALGSIWALVLLSRGKLRRGDYLPFGPFLAAGAFIYWIFLHPM